MTKDVSIRTVRLSKWYGKVTALQEVSLHLGPGIWGLLGPNGSGKTSLLRTIAGQLRPSLGEVKVCGENPFHNPAALRRIGLCPEADALYDELTALEFVTMMARLSGYEKNDAAKRAKDALAAFGLTDATTRKMGGYSRGMRQRAKLAQAIVHDPDVILLDEPLTGTDPTSRHVILTELKNRAEAGALVLFSSHVLHEVATATNQVLLIARGQVVAQGKVSEIRALLEDHPHHVQVMCDRPRDLAARVLTVEGIVGLRFSAERGVEFATRDPDPTYQAVIKHAVEAGIQIESMTSPDANLEALFHYLVERGSQGAGTGADAAVGRAVPMQSQAASPSGGGSPSTSGYESQLKPGSGP